MVNRFACIFWHYYGGALFGFRQKLWPAEKQYSRTLQILAILLYLAQWMVFYYVPPLRLGLAFILLSPQWLYVAPLPHPIFEFRGYSMAVGVALLIAETPYLVSITVVVSFLLCSIHRRRILTSPLAFWEQAQEEQQHVP